MHLDTLLCIWNCGWLHHGNVRLLSRWVILGQNKLHCELHLLLIIKSLAMRVIISDYVVVISENHFKCQFWYLRDWSALVFVLVLCLLIMSQCFAYISLRWFVCNIFDPKVNAPLGTFWLLTVTADHLYSLSATFTLPPPPNFSQWIAQIIKKCHIVEVKLIVNRWLVDF